MRLAKPAGLRDIPRLPANSRYPMLSGRSSGVERHLAKVNVVSSNLIARSILCRLFGHPQASRIAPGERTGERCWPLPLWDEYRKQLDSAVADIQNTGGRPAGTLTAGWFLKEFVGDTPWVHLDIAGTAWSEDPAPYLRKGATGVPTRLFIEWVRERAEK